MGKPYNDRFFTLHKSYLEGCILFMLDYHLLPPITFSPLSIKENIKLL